MAGKEIRYAFTKWKAPKKSRRTADGRRIEIKSMKAVTPLTPADNNPGEARPPSPPTPPPPPPPPPPQSHRMALADLLKEARTGPQAPTQPVADGRANDKQDELDKHGEGIGDAGNTLITATFLCKEQHIGLVCYWSDSDPINRNETWRLVKFGSQENTALFNNGVGNHEQCVLMKPLDFLSDLAEGMMQEFEHRQHMESPQFHKVLHAVRDLYLSLVGYVDKNNDEEKMSKGESGGKGKKVAQTVGKTLNTARKEAEVSRLGKLMEEQARSRAADQKRIERKASEQTRAQKAHADKHKREKGLKEKPGKSNPKQVVATPHLSEAERKALRLIKAAQEQEAKKLEQAEKDQKERLSRLAAEKEKAGGAVEEDETDDALANAIEEALEDLSPHTPPSNKKPVKTTQKESTGTKRPATESATEGSDDRIPPPPAKKQKRATTKRRARPVVEDSSEESDNVKAHKASTKANKMKTPKKIPRPKVSIVDHLAVKAATKADSKTVNQTKKPEVKNSKAHKSNPSTTASTLKDSAVSQVQLTTDKPNSKTASTETKKRKREADPQPKAEPDQENPSSSLKRRIRADVRAVREGENKPGSPAPPVWLDLSFEGKRRKVASSREDGDVIVSPRGTTMVGDVESDDDVGGATKQNGSYEEGGKAEMKEEVSMEDAGDDDDDFDSLFGSPRSESGKEI